MHRSDKHDAHDYAKRIRERLPRRLEEFREAMAWLRDRTRDRLVFDEDVLESCVEKLYPAQRKLLMRQAHGLILSRRRRAAYPCPFTRRYTASGWP